MIFLRFLFNDPRKRESLTPLKEMKSPKQVDDDDLALFETLPK